MYIDFQIPVFQPFLLTYWKPQKHLILVCCSWIFWQGNIDGFLNPDLEITCSAKITLITRWLWLCPAHMSHLWGDILGWQTLLHLFHLKCNVLWLKCSRIDQANKGKEVFTPPVSFRRALNDRLRTEERRRLACLRLVSLWLWQGRLSRKPFIWLLYVLGSKVQGDCFLMAEKATQYHQKLAFVLHWGTSLFIYALEGKNGKNSTV